MAGPAALLAGRDFDLTQVVFSRNTGALLGKGTLEYCPDKFSGAHELR